ncbi:diguanylate cyclase domain-containing protein [Thermomonas brevis]
MNGPPQASPNDAGARRRGLWQSLPLLLAAGLALALLFAAHAVHAGAGPAITPTVSPAYAAERDRLRAEIARIGHGDAQLAAMASLQRLADANGDQDTAQLMEVERIFATHDDAAIDASLDKLNAVRSRVRPQASPELREALARVYGNLYFDVGHFGLALEHQLDALEWAKRLPSEQRRRQATLYRLATIAELYNAMERPDDALRYADMGLAIADADAGEAGNAVSLLGARAMALLQLGRSGEAARALDQAERIDARGAPGFNTLRTAANRAALALATATPDDAMQAVERLQALADQQENGYYRTRAKLLRGQARIAGGAIAEGLRDMRAATAEFERQGQMIDVLDGLDREIRALHAQHAWPEAVASMERRQAIWSRLFRTGQSRAIAELEARQRAVAQQQRIDALAAQVRLERAQVRAGRLRMALFAALALLAACIAGLLSLSRQRARRERDRLSHAVRHDPLTGAFSRYEFQAHGATAAGGAGKALLLLDVDEFKAVNDAYGHAAGDAALKAVVERLRLAMRDGDQVYRWGGEEFLLVLAPRGDAELARDLRALRDAVAATPVAWEGGALAITLSGGLVRHPLAAGWHASLSDSLRWADAAMYAAKHAGRDRIVEVRLAPQGVDALAGQRPIDMAQLLDWERQGLVRLQRVGAAASDTAIP